MNQITWHESLWYDYQNKAVKRRFYENNDFYQLRGKSLTLPVRFFWIKINEILINWKQEESQVSRIFIQPVSERAIIGADFILIERLYPEGKLVHLKEKPSYERGYLKDIKGNILKID